MSKRPPKQGNISFAPPVGARPTVPLPGSAFGGSRPTVGLPPVATVAPGRPSGPSPQELIAALQKGGALLAAGRPDDAESVARLVLRFSPRHPDGLHLLGLVFLGKGNPAEAEKLIGEAVTVARDPIPVMLVNLGNTQREQGKFSAAFRSYDRALKRDPRNFDALLNRGLAHKLAEEFKDALADYERAIEVKPDSAVAYMRAAQVAVEDLGLFREGIAFCERAVENIEVPPAVVFSLMASTYERLTELDKAEEFATRALDMQPNELEGLRVWAKIRRRRNPRDKAVLAEIRARLETFDMSALPPEQIRGIYAELGQICEKQDDVDASFGYFQRMNDAAAEEAMSIGVDKTDYLAQVEDLLSPEARRSTETWPALPLCGVEAGHRAAPVFLVGFPRSGTTLLDQILDAHPDVQVFEEKSLLRNVRQAALDLEGGYPGCLSSLNQDARQQLRDVYWSALSGEGADHAGKIIVDKMPLSIIHARLIARVFPEARIILALRHPMDSVLSCFMQDFKLNASMANFLTIEDAAHLYDRVMTLWQSDRALLPLNVVEVRYENLIRDIRSEVEPVLDFLGLSWNEAQADPAAHALARGTIRTPSYEQVTQPIYSSSADRWRRYDKYLAPVLPVLEKHIRYFGYPL